MLGAVDDGAENDALGDRRPPGSGRALLRLGRQRRHSAVGRIDDERRPPRADHFRAVVPPEVVVGALDVLARLGAPGVLVLTLDLDALERGRFFGGEHRLVGELARPLERRQRRRSSTRPANRGGHRASAGARAQHAARRRRPRERGEANAKIGAAGDLSFMAQIIREAEPC